MPLARTPGVDRPERPLPARYAVSAPSKPRADGGSPETHGSQVEIGSQLRRLYALCHVTHGHQDWWPGDTPFEVCIGAILTQNTAWTNVVKAIENLKTQDLLTPAGIHHAHLEVLAQAIRPSGCFNLKAKRVKGFVAVLMEDFDGDLQAMLSGPVPLARKRLLDIKGIGPETADCMLLYAGDRPSFVVDAYTRRIFSRHGWCRDAAPYEALQTVCADNLKVEPLGRLVDYWQDYHAQLVVLGKEYCRRTNPRCDQCPIRELLPHHPPPLK